MTRPQEILSEKEIFRQAEEKFKEQFKFLPFLYQLKYSENSEKITSTKFPIDQEAFQSEEGRISKEILTLLNKERLTEEEKERLEQLKEELKRIREKELEVLNIFYLDMVVNLRHCLEEGDFYSYEDLSEIYEEIVGSIVDEEIEKKLIKRSLRDYASVGLWSSYIEFLEAYAKIGGKLDKVIERTVEDGLKDSLEIGQLVIYADLLKAYTKIKGGLDKEIERKVKYGLRRCAKEGWWNDYAYLLKTYAEIGGRVDEKIEREVKKGLRDSAKDAVREWSTYRNLLKAYREIGGILDEEIEGLNEELKKEVREVFRHRASIAEWNTSSNLLRTYTEIGGKLDEEMKREIKNGLQHCASMNLLDVYTNLLEAYAEAGGELDEEIEKEIEYGLRRCREAEAWTNYADILRVYTKMMGKLDEKIEREVKSRLRNYAEESLWGPYAYLLKIYLEIGGRVDEEIEREVKNGLKYYKEKRWWYFYAGFLKIYSEIIARSKYNFLNKVRNFLQEKGIDKKYFRFLLSLIYGSASLQEDLRGVFNGFNRFLKIIQTAIKINQETEESKRVKNPKGFILLSSQELGLLCALNPILFEKLINSLIDKTNGLLKLKEKINIYQSLLFDQKFYREVFEVVKERNNLTPYQYNLFLELTAAYQNANLLDEFSKIIRSEENFDLILDKLKRGFFEKMKEILDLGEVKIRTSFEEWNQAYLSKIFTHYMMLEEIGDDDTIELLRKILRASLENRFLELIEDTNNEIGKHNQKVRQEIKNADVDLDTWLNYGEERDFLIEGEIKEEALEEKMKRIIELLEELQKRIQNDWPDLSGPLNKDLKNIKAEEKEELKEKLIKLLKEKLIKGKRVNLEELLPTFHQSIEHKVKFKGETIPLGVQEILGHLNEELNRIFSKELEELKLRKFKIRIWRRFPPQDLFQGNYTHCCIALGEKVAPPGGIATLNPRTILEYLIDQGVQVVEIINQSEHKVIGQCWLWLGKDKNNKKYLIADSFEINNNYRGVKDKIRVEMFEFLKDFGSKLGVDAVILGNTATNKVNTSDLKIIPTPGLEKIGGYFENKPYYFEARRDDNLLIP